MTSPTRQFDAYAGKRVVVTGASGYLAVNLRRALNQTECTMVCVSRRDTLPPLDTARARVEHVAGDITDEALWRGIIPQTDVLFHLAAQTSVPVAEQNPDADRRINVEPMRHILEACKSRGVHPVIVFAGTVTQAGLIGTLPVDESPDDNPITVYDRHKLEAERLLEKHSAAGDVRGVTLRLANVYGPGPGSSAHDRGILNLMIRRALQGEVLTIYGKGDLLRDYIYVDDVTHAFLHAGIANTQLAGRHFVIGSGEGHTVAQAVQCVADRVAALTGKHVRVRSVDPPATLHPIDLRQFVANPKRFSDATGWQPRVKLADGIDRTVEAFR